MRQTTKEKNNDNDGGHTEDPLDWIETMSWDRSQANFCLVSLSPPHCFRYNDLFSPPLFFLFFAPRFILRVLLFIIRLDASPGVSYFSHSFNIFRGRHLFACLFACFFSPRSSNSRIDSAFRFDMVRQSETSIYYGVNFFIIKMKQKIRKQKEMVLLD